MLSLIYENVELFFSSIVDEHFDIVGTVYFSHCVFDL